MKTWRVSLFVLGLSVVLAGGGRAQSFASAVSAADLDPTAFVQWADGAERPVVVMDHGIDAGPAFVLCSDKTTPSYVGVKFGDTKTPGPRHLRIGFNAPVAVGSVLVRGGGWLSVLKPDAPGRGNLADDSLWLPAERLRSREVSHAEAGHDDFALWVLPPGTQTRALRFTHVAEATEKSYAGWLGGFCVLRERLANIAPQAVVAACVNPQHAALITNEHHDQWTAWDNVEEVGMLPVAERPAWVTLVWDKPVTLAGFNALWVGFGAATAQAYVGPADRHPHEAGDADWRTLQSFDKLDSKYTSALGVNWLDFGQPVTTRAVRLLMTRVTSEGHPHLKGRTQDGRRVWLGELLALAPLGNQPLASAILPEKKDELHPPIPVKFKLKEAGFVTLVIEDAAGRRVRNLVSETPFPAGDNVAWWDGTDDLGRDGEAAKHGVYHVPGAFVAPGVYRVRGLFGKEVSLRYEFPVYTAGHPAWNTEDHTGAWLANHAPPSSALFVPAERTPDGQPLVYLGSYVSEGTHGLAWVDLDGKKIGGENWVGGNWTGAPFLTRDDGAKAVAGVAAYAGSVWRTEKGSTEAELRLTALTRDGDKLVVKHHWPLPAGAMKGDASIEAEMGGLAARDGLLVVSLRRSGQLLFAEAKSGKVLGTAPLADPRGLAFDAEGRLLALSGAKLLRFKLGATPLPLTAPETVLANLEDPQQLAFDGAGNICVSDRGRSHQVKIFSAQGKLLRAIGHAGVPQAGPYDPQHMNNPNGLTVDSRQRLWVAETDYQPKRVSVWSLDGKLLNAFYGPSEYGGGGALDPQDPTLFHYAGMTFKLDWERGTSQLINVYYRPGPGALKLAFRSGPPQTALYRNGRRYFVNCYNSSPTSGHGTAFLFVERDGIAVPCAAMGRAGDWDMLKDDAFLSRWPEGADPKGDKWENPALFAWSDLNGDGLAQPGEVTILKAQSGGVTVMPDLAFVIARVDSNTVRYAATKFTEAGAPVLDLAAGTTLAPGVLPPKSSGGDQALASPDGWAVVTLGLAPFSPYSLCGAFKGEAKWSYPSPWPGLHASHEAAVPEFPGEVIGSTRLLGGFVTTRGSDAGPPRCVNGNMGPMYLFTAAGLFVRTLFRDVRQGKPWAMPQAARNMALDDLTPHDENFWPGIAQTPDGRIYLVDGGRSSLVRVDGLDTLRRLPDAELKIGEQDLKRAQEWQLQSEAARQQKFGAETLRVALRTAAPAVDGELKDWTGAQWATIDKRGVKAWFNSNSKPYDVVAALAVAGDRLFAAFRTGDEKLLDNTGETPNAPFKTGGALDLMLGADPKADAHRTAPVPGDQRLLVTLVKGKPLALLYRASVPGTATKDRVPFSSPWRTIYFDRVEDVSAQVQLAGRDGNYEFSIPLASLGLKVEPGQKVRGDLGVLRGSGGQTVQRVYWSNKATAITADVPSEAQLTPQLWGTFHLAP
ncbi:MAG: hypothetical protein NTY53_15300 [Kiritimatiellaeota bacterium]|nr:hypothetical protein [Kiritimatiellota bacterium]